MNNTAASVETIVGLESHIFIHPPDKQGAAAANCFRCGKTAEEHRWKSPRPWPIAEKESGNPRRRSNE